MKKFLNTPSTIIGFVILIIFLVGAILAPFISPHNPAQIFEESFLLPLEFKAPFYLGTDDVGRDLLSRLLHGAQISLSIGALVVLFSLTFGTLLGLIAGLWGGLVDRLIMGLSDILMALPSILLSIVVVSVLGPSLLNAIIAVGLISTPGFIRLVRALVLEQKKQTYILASLSYGAGPFSILFKNILPHCLGPLIVQGTLTFSGGILDTAALGFLGLGAQPPTPEWGTMLADARAYLESAPMLVTLPGLCIFLVVVSLNLLGDGLRDYFDPKSLAKTNLKKKFKQAFDSEQKNE